MKKTAFTLTLVVISLIHISLITPPPVKILTGTWQFAGGVYNGKPDGASKEYTMKRVYTSKNFSAYASQKGYKTEKYEAGNYIIKGDTCFETSTFSSRPSQLVGKTVAYLFKIQNNELVFSGKLPSGMVVEEHWKKIK
jgi:hypothetical protein